MDVTKWLKPSQELMPRIFDFGGRDVERSQTKLPIPDETTRSA